jgi:hypothetical protein
MGFVFGATFMWRNIREFADRDKVSMRSKGERIRNQESGIRKQESGKLGGRDSGHGLEL